MHIRSGRGYFLSRKYKNHWNYKMLNVNLKKGYVQIISVFSIVNKFDPEPAKKKIADRLLFLCPTELHCSKNKQKHMS